MKVLLKQIFKMCLKALIRTVTSKENEPAPRRWREGVTAGAQDACDSDQEVWLLCCRRD